MACGRGCCATFREHLLSVQIAGSPGSTTLMERRWEVDMPAYKRLAESGQDPPILDGAARLESEATTQFEMDSGQIVRDPVARKEMDTMYRESTAA